MLISRASSGTDKQQAKTTVWLRRLFTDPIDGSVIDIDSHRRRFDPTLLRFIDARDQTCRMPGCDVDFTPVGGHGSRCQGGSVSCCGLELDWGLHAER